MGKGRTCAYDEFDMKTLEPKNEPTRIRRAEVDFRPEVFGDKSVLDIGANSGYLSVQAWKAGARSITAVDVQDPCLDSLNELASAHASMPMTVRKQSVAQLDPESDVHDVVLFFEVIHWTTAQGMPIREAVDRVSAVTGETLLIEFPWDIREPSIRAQTKMTIDEYDSSLIFEALDQYFHDVSFERFMTYFAGQKGSRRALVRAARPKLSPAFFDVPGFDRAVEKQISQGANTSSWVRAAERNYFLKCFPAWSSLSQVPIGLCDELLGELANLDGPILAPLEFDSRYARDAGPRRVVAYPWHGRDDGTIDYHDRPERSDSLRLGAEVAAQLAAVPDDLVQRLVSSGFRSIDNGSESASIIEDAWEHLDADQRVLKQFADRCAAAPAAPERQLVHGDLHRSNMVPLGDGVFAATDLDNLTIGTAWTDVIWQAGFEGLDVDDAGKHLVAVQKAHGLRSPVLGDFGAPVAMLLGWLELAKDTAPLHQFERVQSGVKSLINLALATSD